MSNQIDYSKASDYQILLDRAFQNDKRISYAHPQQFLNLINAENGNKDSFLPSKEKQLAYIKGRVSKAVTILIKQKLGDEEKEKLRSLLPQASNAVSSNDIHSIIKLAEAYSRKLIY